MADFEPKADENFTMKKKKKRKQIQAQEKGGEEHEGPSQSSPSPLNSSKRKNKKQKTEAEDRKVQLNLEEGSPWTNLQLILLLQNKDIDLPTKLEVAFNYVQLRLRKRDDEDDSGEVLDTVSMSRVVVFVSNWIESVLISSVKKTRDKGCEGQLETAGSCLDYRCWVILKFCLEESLKVNVPLSYSRDFLRVIDCISRDALTHFNLELLDSQKSALSSEGIELQEIVLNCISLVFSSHTGVVNANLDLWIMVTDTVLELVRKIFKNKVDDSKAGIFILQFSCYLIEPFAKFLRVHPARKNGFHDFIDRLLEPLMHLLDELRPSTCKNPGWSKKLRKLVEEILSQGLFHPAHIDGFLDLQSTVKYKNFDDKKSKEGILAIKSYHRHLFEMLDKIIASKNALPLGGVGELFHLFVKCATKQKRVSSVREGSRQLEVSTGHIFERSSGCSNVALEKYYHSGSVRAETRKPLFDFFVQIMEFFLSHITMHVQIEWKSGTNLLDVLCVLRSANKLLACFKQENIYTRVEDISEGASLNFLRFIYETIKLFSVKIKHLLSSFGPNVGKQDVAIVMAKEIVVAVHHLVDIEYEVVGDDLESLWGMMFTFAACSQSMVDVPDQYLLSLEILNLGCALIDLYSELRQVNTSMFALCKAVRLLVSPFEDSETCTSESYNVCLISLSTFLCSLEFRLSIYNGIKSIPEGQVSGCIQQLTADISESLKWLDTQLQLGRGNDLSKPGCTDTCISWFNLKAELLGRFLSEVYTLILDSMTVTAGNCNAVGSSIKDLIALMCHSSSSGDLLHPDIMEKFFSLVSGRTSSQGAGLENDSLSCWLLVFFFRLYLSCRSLYRQVISLAPPNSSRKMSETMGDRFAAYSGKDWLEGIVQNAEGYFSWIIHPSATLLTVIDNVSSMYLQDTLADCPPLVYVLNVMTLQRLVDLNRMMKSFEYLLARNDKLIEAEIIDDTGISLSHKRSKKWRKHLLIMKQEAAGLTKFMMLCFSSLVMDQLTISNETGISRQLYSQNRHKDSAWDLSVGALDQKTLPSALWLIICQHIDLWCGHAAKKDLKKFLTHLIHCSLPLNGGSNECISHCINKLGHLKNVTTHQISLELLNDTGLYEQKFFRRHAVSTFCKILEASLPSISADFREGYLNSEPDWSEVIHALENSSNAVLIEKCVENNQSLKTKPSSQSVCRLHAETCRIKELPPSSNDQYALCNRLLNLLSWLPKGILNSKSFRSFATCILKLEQVVVGSLLGWNNTLLMGGHDELFRLFLSCRRTLKSLLMASCEENMDQSHSSLICLLLEGSSPVLWLLESLPAVIRYQNAFPEDVASQVKDMLFSLMDHTSHVFLTIGKNQFELAMCFSRMDYDGKDNIAVVCQDTNLGEDRPVLDCSKDNDPWRSLALVADILRELMQNLFARFSQTCASEKLGVLPECQELKELSPVISCIQGFLWGLASGLGNIDSENCKMRVRLSKSKLEAYKLNIFIHACAECISHFLHLILLADDSFTLNLAKAQPLDPSDLGHPSLAKEELFNKIGADANDALHKVMSENAEPFVNIGTHEIRGKSEKSVAKGKCHPKNEDVESLLAKVQLFDQQCLKKTILQELFRGDKSEVAYFLKQLFLAASAMLRLKLELGCTAVLQNIIPILFGISEVLLLEFARNVAPPPFSFVWLDGVVKFLEVLGNCFPSSSPMLSRKLYGKLIDLHLRSIGKCIVLQGGKRVTLSSNETESSMEKTIEWLNFSEFSSSHESYCLDYFIARLRMSFRVLVRKSSDLHLLSAIQAIERAVVGVQEGCLTNYEIHVGSLGGGKVSSIVAAGIDCLDSVIEFVTGRKRLNVVKRHIQSLVACLFNVVLHLQGPSIFQRRVNSSGAYTNPDSGSVILMCIEVLRKVAGKHALFQMDACYVGQSLNIPAALFQNLLQLQLSEALGLSYSPTISETTDSRSQNITSGCSSDRTYSVDLYAACCRLLCTLVKHHKSETQRCTALLEHSISVLLHCLEMVDIDPVVRRGNFAWDVQEGVKCACCLRRVYEEVRQQKDSFTRHCFQFLSCYIWVYCGFGPFKTGIRREIDEALRPGVYALIDACSADDLQHLHTVFGEGPCRSTLATLQNDYKLHFQYEGKV